MLVLDTEVAREIYGPSAVYVPRHASGAIDAGLIALPIVQPSIG